MEIENSGATESTAPVTEPTQSAPAPVEPAPDAVDSTPTEKPKSIRANLHEAWDKASGKSVADKPLVTPKGGDKTTKTPLASIVAPVSWPKEDKELFSTLPPELQKRLTERERDRETDYTKKTQEIAEKRRLFDELEGIVTPYRDSLALQGVSLPQLVNHLLTVNKFIQERPQEAFPWLAQNVKFDLRQLFESQGADNGSPEYQALRQELAQLKGYLQHQHQQAAQAKQSAWQGQVKSYEQQVADFAQSKDDAGEALYPFFDQAQDYITSLVPLLYKEMPNAAVPELLKTAYERAVRAHPELFQKWQEQEQAKQLRQQTQKQNEKIKQAERAGASLSGAPDSHVSQKPKSNSIRDLLEHAWG